MINIMMILKLISTVDLDRHGSPLKDSDYWSWIRQKIAWGYDHDVDDNGVYEDDEDDDYGVDDDNDDDDSFAGQLCVSMKRYEYKEISGDNADNLNWILTDDDDDDDEDDDKDNNCYWQERRC